MMKMKYSEILKNNKELGEKLSTDSYRITVLSNIVVHQVKEIVEFSLRTEGIPAIVETGDYDNIVQDSKKFHDSNAIIIFFELCNIIEGFHYKAENLSDSQLNDIFERMQSEVGLVLKNLKETPLVLINRFSSLSFSSLDIRQNKYDEFAEQMNEFLEGIIPRNVQLVDVSKVLANVGIERSMNSRYFYSSKALYSIDFFKSYADFIKPYFMSANGVAKKALIFDCDNTLWKGVVGEDGFEGIEMSNMTKDGAVFAEVQSLALALNRKGVLIGLCSKNNHDDVCEIIESHKDMQLKSGNITIKKINWSDKASNLKEIANELNIGLDSLVFVDDSPFEVNLVRSHLPEVTVFQVPERLYEYPSMIRECMGLFFNLSFTAEDKKKVDMYTQQAQREATKKEFADVKEYLASLKLKITVFENCESIISRLSQMSQKTNQFNLTTKRYTEGNIQNFISSPTYEVFAFSVSDKFGDSGITGLSIVEADQDKQLAQIDTLLMSCRVIGRNIEYAFMDYIIGKMKEKNIIELKASYVKTRKNEQVKEFFDRCKFNLEHSDDSVRTYSLDVNAYVPNTIDYIEVVNG